MKKPIGLREDVELQKVFVLYKKIKDEIKKDRPFTDSDNHLLNDLSMLEQIKERHLDDIKERGVIVKWRNSDTSFGFKDNPSVDKIMKIIEQQRKLLGEMKITASSKKSIVKSLDPELAAELIAFEKF